MKKAEFFTYREEQSIKVSFPYNPKDVNLMRGIEGRKYVSTEKYWIIPNVNGNIQLLQNNGFLIGEAKVKETATKHKITNFGTLNPKLYPYQKTGVEFIESRGGRCLIADEMGLGKTAQVLSWLQINQSIRPVVVVCPASLKLNWERECSMWMTNPKVDILEGTKVRKIKGDIIIINYDILSYWVDALLRLNPEVLVADECHAVKNKKANRYKALKKLSKDIPHIIGISGTPIVNRPIEIYNIVNIIDPHLFPNQWHYAKKYCAAKHNGFGWDFNGASNTIELNSILSEKIMIRRKKLDVLLELPPKTMQMIPVRIDNYAEYKTAENNFLTWLRETKGREAAIKAEGAEALVAIEHLKQLSMRGKIQTAISWIEDFLETDEKLVIFVTHKEILQTLHAKFKEQSVIVDGSVSSTARQKAVDDFQNKQKVKLFIGQVKAAGVGITLTASSNVLFLEFPWTPGDYAQASDRCHRIGQKKNVTVHNMVGLGTIEERLLKILDEKTKILDGVLDGKITKQENLLTTLLNDYLNEN